MVNTCAQHESGATCYRKTEYPRAKGGEGYAFEVVVQSHLKGMAGGVLQLFVFIAFTHTRSDRVNHIPGL